MSLNSSITRLKFGEHYLFVLVLCIAVILRLIWANDMEWKADEVLMYNMAKEAAETGSLPWVGMKSGIGLANAGFSIWPFVLFYKISSNPLNMVRMVMWSNVFALLLMWYCASRLQQGKRVMQFGVLLTGVNVLMVLFSRKIWAQDMMPVFIATMWYLQLQRKTTLVLFLWGAVSALAGQLHMSGFFFAFGLFLGSCINRDLSLKKAGIFVMGFGIGLLPAIPWLQDLFSGAAGSDANAANILKFEFFLHAIIDPLGINAQYSLGADLKKFAAFGWYLPVLAVITIAALFVYSLVKAIKKKYTRKDFREMLQQPIAFYFFSMVLVPGILLTLSGSPIRSHYLIGAAPFLHAGFAWVWYSAGKRLMWVVVFSQLAITVLFLFFVHQNTRINGDYGVPYRHQKILVIP
jgi:hypothetical protein